MNKSHKYTFLTLLLASVFIFGSMAGMNLILRVREGQLLTERGSALAETPVRAWGDLEDGEEAVSDKRHQETYTLTVEQMEEVIGHWNSREGDIIHEPVTGQISMAEAIENSKEWLLKMNFVETKSDNDLADSVNATLSIGKKRETLNTKLEPYYSFWTVRYANRDMEAELLLNAVTGKVWGAKITIYENRTGDFSSKDAMSFWDMAGLPMPETDVCKISYGQTWEIYGAEETTLGVRIGCSNYDRNENAIVDYGDLFHKEHTVITYDFVVDEK
ncbi:MAG: hypothetical protein HFH36_04785 [Lachnospiraceae bacterium]|nr:hypothetical protein [Lachnospiraceae bacterium]